MEESEIYAQLSEIFRDVFLTEDIVLRPDLSAKDVAGWDSFKQIEIIVATEAKFGIKLSSREVDHLQNVGDLAGAVVRKTAGRT